MSTASADFTDEVRPLDLLIVDDEGPVRDLLARWLSDAGFRCHRAKSADEAWAILKNETIALATLDVNLPGTSGIELLPQIRAMYANTEVIMLTGRNDAHSAIAALSEGASSYLIKPVAAEELLFQVRRSLERRQFVIDKLAYTNNLERRVRQQTMEIRHAHEETIHRLVTAASLRDEETGAHIRRVGLYSELFAEALNWSAQETDQIRMAAPMHDIGKIGIPDAILRKPGRLTADEYEVMKRHTTIGGEVLSGAQTPVLKLAREIALHHHERWDGRGYPNGISREMIPEAARIVSIVDVYDALTHDRVYRAAYSRDKCLELMEQESGTQFDPILFRLFSSLEPEIHRISAENPDELEQAELPFAAAAFSRGPDHEAPQTVAT